MFSVHTINQIKRKPKLQYKLSYSKILINTETKNITEWIFQPWYLLTTHCHFDYLKKMGIQNQTQKQVYKTIMTRKKFPSTKAIPQNSLLDSHQSNQNNKTDVQKSFTKYHISSECPMWLQCCQYVPKHWIHTRSGMTRARHEHIEVVCTKDSYYNTFNNTHTHIYIYVQEMLLVQANCWTNILVLKFHSLLQSS